MSETGNIHNMSYHIIPSYSRVSSVVIYRIGGGSVFVPEIERKIWPQRRRRHRRHPVDTDQCFRLSRLGHVFPRRVFRPIRNNFPRPDGRPTADGVYIIYMHLLFQPLPPRVVFSPTSPFPPQYDCGGEVCIIIIHINIPIMQIFEYIRCSFNYISQYICIISNTL